MTTKITSVCDGRPSFRHFCHLSCMSCSNASDCRRPFSIMCIALRSDNFLAQGQPVSCTSCDLVFVSSDEEGISLRLSLQSSHLLDLVVRNDPRQKEFLAVLWVLGQCRLYLVTYGFHKKNIPTTTFGGAAFRPFLPPCVGCCCLYLSLLWAVVLSFCQKETWTKLLQQN